MKGYQKTNTRAQDLTEIVYKQNGFLSGLNADNPKSEVGDTQVPVLENLIPYRDRLEARGGLKPNSSFSTDKNSNAFMLRNKNYLFYDEDWEAFIYPGYVSTKSGVYDIKYMHGMTTEYDETLLTVFAFAKIGNKLVMSSRDHIVVLEKRSSILYVMRPLASEEAIATNLTYATTPGTIPYSFRCTFIRKINGVVEAESNPSSSQILKASSELDGVTNEFKMSLSTISLPSDWDAPDGGYENFYTHIRFYRSKVGTGTIPESNAQNSTHYQVGDYALSLGLPVSDVFLDLNVADEELSSDTNRVVLWNDGYEPFSSSLVIEASSAFLIARKEDFISKRNNEFIYTPLSAGDNQKYFGWYDPLFQYGASVNGDINCIKDLGTYCVLMTKGKTYYLDTVNYSQDSTKTDLGIFAPILNTTVLADDTIGINFWHRNAAVKVSQGELIALTSFGEIRKFSNFKWGVDLSRGKVHSITKGKILKEELSASAAFVNDTYWLVYREPNPLYENYQILNTLRLGTTEESGYGFTVFTGAPETKGDYLNAKGWPYHAYVEADGGDWLKGYHVDVLSVGGSINFFSLQNVDYYGTPTMHVYNLLEYTGDSFDRNYLKT